MARLKAGACCAARETGLLGGKDQCQRLSDMMRCDEGFFGVQLLAAECCDTPPGMAKDCKVVPSQHEGEEPNEHACADEAEGNMPDEEEEVNEPVGCAPIAARRPPTPHAAAAGFCPP